MKHQKIRDWVEDTKERLELEATKERIERAEREQKDRLARLERVKRQTEIIQRKLV